jgi:hypothetical protein
VAVVKSLPMLLMAKTFLFPSLQAATRLGKNNNNKHTSISSAMGDGQVTDEKGHMRRIYCPFSSICLVTFFIIISIPDIEIKIKAL